jgi:myo-inositol-1(or 4)-monophosphatase
VKPTLTDLTNLAHGAGKILRASFGKRLHVTHKGVIDLVTDADQRSEAYLVGEIQRQFPGHRVIAEETGESLGNAEQTWYIDPLDGTVNYAHGLPIFAVSIAYAEQGKIRLGVVYDPTRDECFRAERGRGAWLNRMRLHVSQTRELDKSLLVTGFPYDIRTNPHNNLDNFVRFALAAQAVRRLGSAALDLCYVAAGRFDGYWEISLKAWDVAAGALIAEQAGAVVTNLSGGSDYLSPPQSVLAANPLLHPQILALLNLQRAG